MSAAIAVLDYGTGNLGSIFTAFEAIGRYASLAADHDSVLDAEMLVLPGVGAAASALTHLESSGMKAALRERLGSRSPVLGICLGAQLLGSVLREGNVTGIGWFQAEVGPIRTHPFYNNGWCHLEMGALKAAGLSRGLHRSSTFFFNHRYYVHPSDVERSVPTVERPEVAGIFLDEVVCGVQFHPEKSQEAGRILLRNVVEDHYGL